MSQFMSEYYALGRQVDGTHVVHAVRVLWVLANRSNISAAKSSTRRETRESVEGCLGVKANRIAIRIHPISKVSNEGFGISTSALSRGKEANVLAEEQSLSGV
jgi:hypothetical protein